MTYHIALSIPFDLEGLSKRAELGLGPRHTMWDLSQTLEAEVHQPDVYPISLQDKISAKLISQPEHWAMARGLVKQLNQYDAIFCVGEDIGLPLAILCRGKKNRPKLMVTVMAPDRLRFRTITKVLNLGSVIDLFVTNTEAKASFIRDHLGVALDRIYVVPEQTDAKFFTPGSASTSKSRPLVASAGREQRDYKTLALATQDLNVDVDICALSPNRSSSTRVAFPDPVPSNMSFHPYEWPEFKQLYRNADVVVISLLDNHYSAGLTSLMEAMACRRPVIITDTPGLARKLIELGVVLGVNPGDFSTMRKTLLDLLENPDKADKLAEKGYRYFLQNHTSEIYVDGLVQGMQKLNFQQQNQQRGEIAKSISVAS